MRAFPSLVLSALGAAPFNGVLWGNNGVQYSTTKDEMDSKEHNTINLYYHCIKMRQGQLISPGSPSMVAFNLTNAKEAQRLFAAGFKNLI